MAAMFAIAEALTAAHVLSSGVSFAVAGTLCLLVIAPRFAARRPIALTALVGLIYVAARSVMLGSQSVAALPALDACAIPAVAMAGCAFSRQLVDVDNNVSRLLSPRADRDWVPFEQGRNEIYREVRRAREHGRPLTLVSLTLPAPNMQTPATISQLVDRQVELRVAQQAVAEALRPHLSECDTITARGEELIILLTETDGARAAEVVAQARADVQMKVEIDIEVGWASFPDDEVTFVGLAERAAARRTEPCLDADKPVIAFG